MNEFNVFLVIVNAALAGLNWEAGNKGASIFGLCVALFIGTMLCVGIRVAP